ncbi:MAG: hypothetical protein RBT62_09530 [Spirochaetia bacterium]|nr:hypothetical protein [Spirochaetia bacterium]
MMKIPALALSLSLLGLSLAPYAQTVEVTLFETPLELGSFQLGSSELVIGGVLDGLFASGFIATNSRPVSGDKSAYLSFIPGIDEKEGRVDFVIVILAQYPGVEPVPACSFRLIRVSDGLELVKGSVPAVTPNSMSAQDIEKACSSVGVAITAGCAGALRGLSTSRRSYVQEEA